MSIPMAAPEQARRGMIKLVGKMRSLADKGEVEKVRQLMQTNRKKATATPHFWGLMQKHYINAHVNSSKHDRFELEALCDKVQRTGFKMQQEHYLQIINALGKKQKMNAAIKYAWDKMLKDGFKPNVTAFNTLLSAFKLDPTETRRTVESMKKSGIEPTDETQLILAKSQCIAGEFVKAWALVVTPKGIANERFFSDYMELSLRQRKHLYIQKAYNEVVRRQIPVTDRMVRILVDSKIRQDGITAGGEYFRQLQSLHPEAITGGAWTSLLRGYCEHGSLQDALSVFGEMCRLHIKPKPETYECLVEGYVKANRLELAGDLLDFMEKDGMGPTATLLNTLIRGQIERGHFQIVEHMRQVMESKRMGLERHTYGALIAAYSKNSDLEKAEECMEEMRNRVGWSAYAGHSMAVLYSNRRLGTRLLGLIRRMLTDGIQPTKETREILHLHFSTSNEKLLASASLQRLVMSVSEELNALDQRTATARKNRKLLSL